VKPLSLQRLKSELVSAVERNRGLALRLSMDKRAPISRIIKVMDVAKECKIGRVDVGTEQPDAGNAVSDSPARSITEQGKLRVTKSAIATNGVTLTYGQTVLNAEEVSVDLNSGQVQARGDVRLQQTGVLRSADQPTFNLNTNQKDPEQDINQLTALPSLIVTNTGKSAEATQSDTRALGFDWYLGNLLTANGNSVGPAAARPALTNKRPSQPNPPGPFPGSADVAEIQIGFVGPPSVKEADIRTNIHVRVGAPFDRSAVDRDVRDLYVTGLFYNVRVGSETNAAGLKLSYIVQCNPRLVELKFKGNTRFSDADLQKIITSKVGALLNEKRLFLDSQQIQEKYEQAGYQGTLVKYVTEYDEERGEAKATFQVTESR
jgi:hypothetical protein